MASATREPDRCEMGVVRLVVSPETTTLSFTGQLARFFDGKRIRVGRIDQQIHFGDLNTPVRLDFDEGCLAFLRAEAHLAGIVRFRLEPRQLSAIKALYEALDSPRQRNVAGAHQISMTVFSVQFPRTLETMF